MLMIMGSGLSLSFLAGLVVVSFYTIKSSFSFLFVGTPTNWWMMTTKLKLVPSFAMSLCNSFKKEKDHYGLFLLTKWRKLTYFENHAQKYNSFFIHSVILQYQIDYKIIRILKVSVLMTLLKIDISYVTITVLMSIMSNKCH